MTTPLKIDLTCSTRRATLPWRTTSMVARPTAVLLAAFFAHTCAAYTPQWTQPRLFVSFWYDPVVTPLPKDILCALARSTRPPTPQSRAHTSAPLTHPHALSPTPPRYDPVVPPASFPHYYAQIAEANFTAVLGGFGALTAEAIEAQLGAADALGLGVVAATNFNRSNQLPVVDYGGKHPSLWGYQIKDEPNAAQFPGVAAFSDAVAAAVPGKLRFNNLLPHCPVSSLNATSYDSYVQTFVDTVRPDVLSFDYYPSFQVDEWANAPSMSDYRSNLDDMRRHALKAGVPFWNFFGVQHVFGGQPDPTEAQSKISSSIPSSHSPHTPPRTRPALSPHTQTLRTLHPQLSTRTPAPSYHTMLYCHTSSDGY